MSVLSRWKRQLQKQSQPRSKSNGHGSGRTRGSRLTVELLEVRVVPATTPILNGINSGSTGSISKTFTPALDLALTATSTSVTGTPSPSTFGQPVTLSAFVTSAAGVPSGGTVTFIDGTTALGTVNINSSATATLTTSALPSGTQIITATYSGTATLGPSSGTLTQTVNPAATTTTTVTGNPNPSTVGQQVTFTATVTAVSGIPTGSVSFFVGGTLLSTVQVNSTGSASLAVTTLQAGTQTITASYSGASGFAASSSAVNQIVNAATTSATTTTLFGSPNPSTLGQSVTFTATVTSPFGTPTGTVTFLAGSTNLGTASLNAAGQATISTNSLPAGTQTITATYTGSATFASSFGTTSQTVSSAATSATTTNLIGSPNPSSVGQTVTFTATVTSPAGTPTGSVLFFTGSTVLGIANLNNVGSASLSVSTLPSGTNLVQASYGGGPGFSPSLGSVSQTVGSSGTFTTNTTVAANPNPATLNQLVTLTASVSSSSGIPTGIVQFLDNGTNLGTASLNGSGLASLGLTTFTAGTHTISATYEGSQNFAISSGSTLLTVNSATAATTTVVSSTLNPSSLNQPVTFTATVTSFAGTPTGSVVFEDGGTNLGTTFLNGAGQASVNVSTLTVGTHTITAVYQATANFATSSGSTQQTVNGSASAVTTTTVTGTPNPSTVNQLVMLTATVTSPSGIPTGIVDFSDGTNDLGTRTLNGAGQANFAVSNLTAGTHTITVTYDGAPNFQVSSGTTQLTVTGGAVATTNTTVSGTPNPSAVGQLVTFTANVFSSSGIPTGTVQFLDGFTNLGSASLNGSGQAVLSTTNLTAGTHTITATYQGSASFASSSGTTTQTVTNGAATTTTTSVVGVPNPASVGQLVTFTATVISAAGTPTGTVQFLDGSTNLGIGTLNGLGQASVSTSTLAAGTHSISATYSGSSTFSASTGFTTETVGQSTVTATTTAVSATPNPSALGQAVALTATVRSIAGIPTGTVTFVDGSTNLGTATLNVQGVATISLNTLPAGTQTITAFYSGALLFGASSGSVTVTVNGGVVPGNPVETWVNQLYRDLLGRNGDPGGVAFWAQKVNAGASRTAVALQFEQTPEALAALVNNVYEGTLHRAADPAGLSGAEALLIQNGSVQNLQATLQGSTEYFQVRAGLNQLAFLNSLYSDALGSLPTPLVVSQLLPLLNSGFPHLALAQVVESSAAADAHYVASLFNQYLGRGVDPAGLQFDVDFLQRGGRDDQLIANILGSDEYFQRAQAGL
jgi:Bacterial Ig-like domain (group 3)/Domain of unknown function (DUF4214)